MNIRIDTAEDFKQAMKQTPYIGGKLETFQLCSELLRDDGLILEFGVKAGNSINKIASFNSNRTVYGFDSFEGLPEDWIRGDKTLKKGRYKQIKLPKVERNVQLIKGWFVDTIPIFKKTHSENISFINIDSDLYASCKTILWNLNSQIKIGTVIHFDELCDWTDQGYTRWVDHEYRALKEWVIDFDREISLVCWSTNYGGVIKIEK